MPDGCRGWVPAQTKPPARFGASPCLGGSSREPECRALGLCLQREARFCNRLDAQRWCQARLDGDEALVADSNACGQHGVSVVSVRWWLGASRGPSSARGRIQVTAVVAAMGLGAFWEGFGCFSSPVGVERRLELTLTLLLSDGGSNWDIPQLPG